MKPTRNRGGRGLENEGPGCFHRLLSCLLPLMLLAMAPAVMAHGCDPEDKYLIGHYHGECDEGTELPHGKGEAKGADTYVGHFVQGKPDGKGVYTWENGARLDGTFTNGKANGPGVYWSAKGVRYDGRFMNGRYAGMKAGDCPTTPGPLTC